jgi:methionyl aminopeptidase
MLTKIKTSQELDDMRTSGKILANVLETVKQKTSVGMTTYDMAVIASSELSRLGGKPVFLGYSIGSNIPPFPSVICISINDEVVHGIPNKQRVIKNGDLVSIDFGVAFNNMITDAAISYGIGDQNSRLEGFVKTTKMSLMAGISVLSDGVRVGDVSAAVQQVLKRENLGIVRDLVGHGVGHHLHEEPDIPNYGFAGSGPILKSGMTIAIEPMATLGGHSIEVDPDHWTIRTLDGSLAAHFEHTVLILDNSYEILTEL